MKFGCSQWAAYSLVLLLGILMVTAIGINSLDKDQELRNDLIRSGDRVTGVITDMRGARGSTNSPHMKFRTRDGREVETTYGDGMAFPEQSKLFVGMIVDVVYDPVDPTRAIPAPYSTVLKRDVTSDLGAFLRRMGYGMLVFGLPILILALIFSKIFARRAKSG